MIKTFKKLLALTLVSATSMSCSLAFLSEDETHLDGDMRLVVNGVVSDVATNTPISDIKITFSAFAENSLSVLPLIRKTAYTDSNGEYSVEAAGFSESITCIMTAESTEDRKQQYESMESVIVVTWNGNSFDERNNTFYVNDCNFQMKKDN
ncbi:MAG: hypothetical protein IKY66_04365 [Bacteroidales bacterium]|nr:hypothetical protein [Bacteroidales bacterium]